MSPVLMRCQADALENDAVPFVIPSEGAQRRSRGISVLPNDWPFLIKKKPRSFDSRSLAASSRAERDSADSVALAQDDKSAPLGTAEAVP